MSRVSSVRGCMQQCKHEKSVYIIYIICVTSERREVDCVSDILAEHQHSHTYGVQSYTQVTYYVGDKLTRAHPVL